MFQSCVKVNDIEIRTLYLKNKNIQYLKKFKNYLLRPSFEYGYIIHCKNATTI